MSYYCLESRNQIINAEYSEDSALFFVDGLGAEYLGFLAERLSSHNDVVQIKIRVGRCNLPSVTKLNKDFLHGRRICAEMIELDTLKHSPTPYPANILAELGFLDTLPERLLRELTTVRKIILCSDHGTSRLAVLARHSALDESFPVTGRKVYKSGRYADARAGDAQRFPTAVEYDGKTIFADYARFVQKGSTGSELHGGASPEEVLVPIITIERKTETANDLRKRL